MHKTPLVWIFNPSGLNNIMIPEMNGILGSDSPHIEARFEMIGYLDNEKPIPSFFEKFPQYSAYKAYLENPLCFYPESSGNQRIIVQKGIFTIHGTKIVSINGLMRSKNKESYLKKILINSYNIEIIRQDLRLMGITPRSVYPDLYGLQSEIREISIK